MKAIEEYTSAGEFHTGLPSLSLPVLTPPTGLDDTATAVQITLWELDVKDYQCKLDDCQHNQQKAYALILGQCSQAIQDCLEAHASWSTVNDVSDMIELLKLIHSSIYQQATTRKGTHALIEAESALMQFHNRSLLSSGGLMADVPCLDHSLDGCKGRPDDVQTTKHARRTHAWSRCARTSLGAHASLFGASGARFWIVTRATSARIEEPSMVSILYIKSSIPDTYK